MNKIIGKIFNPEKLGDSIISGVDKAILSKEEKLDYMAKFLKLYEPYKLAQRILAIMFSGVFLLVHLLIFIVHLTLLTLEKSVDHIRPLYTYNNDSLGTVVLIITSFYFCGGVIEGTVNRFKNNGNTAADNR